MNCRIAEELIQRSLDALLSPTEGVRLDTHLADCPACRQTQSQYRRLSQAAGEWAHRPIPTELSPDEFTAQVLARLAAKSAPRSIWPRLLAGGLTLGLAALSSFVTPRLPALMIAQPVWPTPSLASWLLEQLQPLPQQTLGLWTITDQSLMASHWAALLLTVAVPVNALLCLSARRNARRTA